MGMNYRGENLYEFIFATKDDLSLVDGDDWDKVPADGNPSPPDPMYIDSVASLTTMEVDLNVIQDSTLFGVYDSVDGIISLGWEHIDEDFEGMEEVKRLVFHYGETFDSVTNKLYARDLIITPVNGFKVEEKQ
tara:strand:+ start:17695 stop:18093 length:399 start_codon:yes stop_codon:yes gene_type:complete